jgi:hypothetical protein
LLFLLNLLRFIEGVQFRLLLQCECKGLEGALVPIYCLKGLSCYLSCYHILWWDWGSCSFTGNFLDMIMYVGSMLRRRRSSRKKRLSAEAACVRWPKVPLHEASVLQTNLRIE